MVDSFYPSWFLSKYNGTTIDPPIEMKWGYHTTTTYYNRRLASITLNSWGWVATSLYPQTGNTRNRFYIMATANDDGLIESIDDKLYVSTTAHDITFSNNNLSIETFDGSADLVECTRAGAIRMSQYKYFVLEEDLSAGLSAKADVSALTAYALSTDVANELTNYLPLSGGTLSSGNASIEVAPTHISFHNDYTLTSDNQQVLHVKNPTTIDFALLSSDDIDGTSLKSQLLAKQDKLTNAQVSAINQVVDERATIIDFGNGDISAFNWSGMIDLNNIIAAYLWNGTGGGWNKQPIDVKIGTMVSCVGYSMFDNCSDLPSVTMPDSIKVID